MAEYAVGPLISMLNNKLSSYLLVRYKVMAGMEEQHEILERKLPAILNIIEDAEEKGAHRSGVSAWLKVLKKVACEANDVFDEFKYEALRRDAKEKGHYKKLGFDIVSIFPAHNPIVFRYRMGKKLCSIVHIIEVLVTEMNHFGFKHMAEAPASKKWRDTDSIIIDSEKDIVSRSRDEEKNKIMNILIDQASDGRDLIVLPIVGMGGLGKTTFAQLVYNDPAIKEHFQLRRWCCVSDDFDVVKIANSICQTSENDRDKALQDLQNGVSGKRFLIVLDDVWNEDADKWKKLRTCLRHGGKGSAVLTTTRKEKVAEIMKVCINDSHDLGKLPKVFLKEIFENRAFCSQKPEAAELSDMVDKILNRCGGSPLAAKAFGSMLSTKTDMKEWRDVLTRSNSCNAKTETLPILKLSYDDLPPHLKQCFAFCAIFPKDYEIDVEILIQLWMAHDFIPVKEDDILEKVGREIFDELTWRSFFQDVKRAPPQLEQSECHSRTVCKIHDLMHDIALSVMGKDCLTIVDRTNQKDLLSAGPTRHLFSSCQFIGTLLDGYLKKQSPTLQTLLYDPNSEGSAPHLSKYSHLRALQLFELRKLPLRPRHLQHLRYLDLSNNKLIKELPKEISILYNLQTLKVSNCTRLGRLPNDMKYMKNLRHLYTNGCTSLECMPSDLGQLTSLQTLTYFVASSSPRCTIRELRDLNLGGELELSCLEYVTEEHAKASSLGNKEKLTHLSLKWSDDSIEELDQHRNVLDALRPHAALEFLGIDSYGGTTFPTWATSLTFLQQLTRLHLIGCTMCEEFPHFCQFKALQVLILVRLNKLQCLCSHYSSAAFPALRDLVLENLEIFDRWVAIEGEELAFPVLENVRIVNCPKLTTLPEAPKLKLLELEEDKAQLSLTVLSSKYMAYLSILSLSVSDKEATPTPKLDQDSEVSLDDMDLIGCSFLFPSSPLQPAVGVWKWFGQLVTLHIDSCDTLVYWPEEEFQSLVSLKHMFITNCSELIGPTQMKGCRTRGRGQFLPKLINLTIEHCGSLRELFILPPSLAYMKFEECHSLEFILGQDDRELESLQYFDTALLSKHCNDLASNNMPELSPSHRNNPLPCLEGLKIQRCNKIHSLPAQLDTLLYLGIWDCSGLESLECLGDLPLLRELFLVDCKRLASVPGSSGSQPSLVKILIRYCPTINMKPIYEHLQRRLDSLEFKDLSHAGSSNPIEGPKLWETKSWKYAIPGLRPKYRMRR